MQRVHAGPVAGTAGVLALLAALAATIGLAPAGWAAGAGLAVVVTGALDRGMRHHRTGRLGPANRVTLTRLVLTCGVAALVATSFGSPVPTAALVPLAAAALSLDAVDGRVARRTGTMSALGARFDMEVDALLILVLSVYVGHATGWWVLAIGLARYLLGAARRLSRRLRGPVPPRRWCKVVAAVQGIVLIVVASGLLAPPVATTMLVVALVLLAESFGREVWESWRATAPHPEVERLATAGVVGRG